MATLRNKRKLATATRETQEENPKNSQSRNTSVPRFNEEYIAQVSEEIEGRGSKKLSQEFIRTESRILGALSKLDEFLSNQQIHTHFETVPGTFRNSNVENQGTNEDDSQSDPHPEAGIFCGQTTQNLGPKDCRNSYSIKYSDFLIDTVFIDYIRSPSRIWMIYSILIFRIYAFFCYGKTSVQMTLTYTISITFTKSQCSWSKRSSHLWCSWNFHENYIALQKTLKA